MYGLRPMASASLASLEAAALLLADTAAAIPPIIAPIPPMAVKVAATTSADMGPP
jgi:hypothetical protein